MLDITNNDILKMEQILNMEFIEIVNYLVIRKQQHDLDWYLIQKPNLEHKKTYK